MDQARDLDDATLDRLDAAARAALADKPMSAPYMRYMAMVHPVTVLAMVDEIRRLREEPLIALGSPEEWHELRQMIGEWRAASENAVQACDRAIRAGGQESP